MSVPLVVILDKTDLDLDAAVAALEAAGFEVVRLRYDLDDIIPSAVRHAVAAIVGYTRVDDRLFTQLPHLAAVATCSVGTDMVDAQSAAERGVRVIGLASPSTEEVAAHALTLLLAAERSLPLAQRVTASGEWTEQFDAVPRRLSMLTLGLLGYGRIAQRLHEIASPLVGEIIAHDPYVASAPGSEMVSRGELLRRSDLLSLHLPLTAETIGTIGHSAIGTMRRGVVLINTSRGGLIDRHALLQGLDDGIISAAALDVLEDEPPAPDDPLRSDPRVIVTPHIGFLSDHALRLYNELPGKNLVTWWKTTHG